MSVFVCVCERVCVRFFYPVLCVCLAAEKTALIKLSLLIGANVVTLYHPKLVLFFVNFWRNTGL